MATKLASDPPSQKSRVFFHFLRQDLTLSQRIRLKSFLAQLVRKEGKRLESIQYIFCSDAYLLDINKRYLNHDTYTDIITFDLSEPGKALNAEIYISVDRIRDNARQFQASVRSELHRVMFHGALHLCGYTDKTLKEKELMRKMEDKYLGLYFMRPR